MVNYKDLGLVNTRDMFAKAIKGGYAIPAFNFNNMEQLQAIVKAAVETKSPVILQVSKGARNYANQTLLRYMAEGAVEYASILKVFLFGLLHLYQEFFSLFVLAIHVEDGLPFCGVMTEVLHVEVVEGFDDLGPVKQRVEKADEQVFVGFCPE